MECAVSGEGHLKCPTYRLTKDEMMALLDGKPLPDRAAVIGRSKEPRGSKPPTQAALIPPSSMSVPSTSEVVATGADDQREMDEAVATILDADNKRPAAADDIRWDDEDSIETLDSHRPFGKRMRLLSPTQPPSSSTPHPSTIEGAVRK